MKNVILCRTPNASERLAALAAEVASQQQGREPSAQSTEKALSVAERLQQALIKGDSSQLQNDLMEALSQYPSPVAIIEGPLMEGMNIVGKRFGEGQMFLPQVVKTARTMKEAVAILQPYLDARPLRHAVGCTCAECQQQTAEKPLVLLATVKGDVHDIGKNIVSVVMACNGYRIVDLGVMVPAEEIVAKAKELHPDVIGLSGLITPSLSEMVTVATELQQAGLHIPLMIGGATTSELHTALRIAPVYDAPVVHVRDASQNSRIAAEMLRPSSREAFVTALRERQAKQRAEYESKHEELLSLDEARKRHLKLFD